jgi:diguanylate cyclase (GGDEF)-like protein
MRRMRQRSRNPEPVTALLFDLDHFKSVNDRFGHPVGDEVLRLFTAKAVAEFRSTDLMGRLGGEEFGALLFGATEGTAVATAERIRRALMVATAEIGEHQVDATVSVGIAVAQADIPENVAELFARADNALYRAKERGRNRVEIAGRITPAAFAPEPVVMAPEPQAPLDDVQRFAWSDPQPCRNSSTARIRFGRRNPKRRSLRSALRDRANPKIAFFGAPVSQFLSNPRMFP